MSRTLILVLPFVLTLPHFLSGQKDSFLVKPYLQFGTQQSMHVLWETTGPATTIVEYGEAKLSANEPNLDLTMTLDGRRTLHEVKLDNLQAATKYLYRVKSVTASGQELTSEVSTFRTAVHPDDAYFFALIGDSQYNGKTPWAWGKIAQKVWEERPHFIIHAGDLVDIGSKKTDWTGHFFPNGHVAMSRFPMYTVLGNHEQDAQLYYDYMVNPAPEYYYTFNYGNAQFFMIDTNKDVHEGSEQYDWLEWALAQSTATWKFVVHHHPPYSTEENDHGDTYIGASSYGTKARDLTPLYDAYGVDFCLFGHTHVYERTWPLFNNRVNLRDGVVYINSGGAGGGLEDFDPTRSWFTQELQTGHHYCTFAIFENRLIFKAISHDGQLFDTFQMEKDGGDRSTSMVQPPAPHFKVEKLIFEDRTAVELTALEPAHEIHYTLDGSEPGKQSARYVGPVVVDKSAILKARVFTKEGKASRVVSRELTRMDPLPAVDIADAQPGLQYRYYEGEWDFLPDFSTLSPSGNGIVESVNEELVDHREDGFAVVLEGYVDLPRTDTYTFFTRSDDGSRLYIDGLMIVDSDGRHGAFWEYGTTILEQGKHRLRIEYFEASGSHMLRAGVVDEVLGKVPFNPGWLTH